MGSHAHATTNKYHYYWLGNGLTAYHSGMLGDDGVTGNNRRWGYFDEKFGLFFMVSGTTLCVGSRNTLNGVTTDSIIEQQNWNVDKLDGSGLSKNILRPSEYKTYWMDYHSRARFGIIGNNGERIICHEMVNTNPQYPIVSNMSLPMGFSNRNTEAISSSPTIKVTQQVVVVEGNLDYTFWKQTYQSNLKTITTGATIPILSIRSKVLYQGETNDTNVYPETFSCNVSGGRVKLELYWDCELSGATWNLDNGGTVEGDHDATAIIPSGSTLYRTWYLNDNAYDLDMAGIFEINDEGLLLNSDYVTHDAMSFVATYLSGSPTMEGSILYKELR